MKILLTLIMCSYVEGVCMPDYKWPEHFNSMYDCMIFGYEESQRKMEEIGRSDVNQHVMNDGSGDFYGCIMS